MYGLSNISQLSSYLTVKQGLLALGAEVSKCDQAIFKMILIKKLHGIILSHVDDISCGGTKIFKVAVIDKLQSKFVVKSEVSLNFVTLAWIWNKSLIK